MSKRVRAFGLAAALILPLTVSTATPATASGYRIRITCKTPQPARQLYPKDCLNYLPDGGQTYTAHVTDSAGRPVAGVLVRFSDSDAVDAHFRKRLIEGRTDSRGQWSDELVDTNPVSGDIITAKATVVSTGTSDSGTLRFR